MPRSCVPARAPSVASSFASHAFSSAFSQVAFAGRSVSVNSTTMPKTTAGTPSTRNSHCQPARPSVPLSPSSSPPSGAPTMLAIGMPIMNREIARARSRSGYQWLR